MTKLFINLFILTFLFYVSEGYGQTCRVLKTGISASYSGNCKKGLAHGQGTATGADTYEGQFRKGLPHGNGTYRWANGDVYSGQWKEGNRNGIGKFSTTINLRDTIFDGQWVNDRYAGPVIPKPLIKSKENVDRFTFRKSSIAKNRVMVNMYQNGARNGNISDLMITSTSGYESSLGPSVGYEDVTFPVTVKVMYTTQNKLNTALVYVKFEFEISEPGDWTVDIHN